MNHFDQPTITDARDCVQASEDLVREYYTYIHRLAFSILQDSQDADEAAQDTFLAAHRALSGYRGQAHIKTWLTRIAINACRSRLRKRKTRQALQTALESLHLLKVSQISPEEGAVRNEVDRELWQALEALDEKHRLPIILHYVHELSLVEIAQSLDIPQGTARSRLHYARKKLQMLLGYCSSQEETLA